MLERMSSQRPRVLSSHVVAPGALKVWDDVAREDHSHAIRPIRTASGTRDSALLAQQPGKSELRLEASPTKK